jgi:hypothetical protein
MQAYRKGHHFGNVKRVTYKHGHVPVSRFALVMQAAMRATLVHFLPAEAVGRGAVNIAPAAARAFGFYKAF